MAIPLKKGQPEFEDEQEITTGDLAQPNRPKPETRGPQAVPSGGKERQSSAGAKAPSSTDNARNTPLFPNAELESLRTRWKEIQTAFVDEPRKAVEQADGLVASAMKRLAEVFSEERSRLEKQWDRGESVSTEDLRVALQRYRSFFDRLLSV